MADPQEIARLLTDQVHEAVHNCRALARRFHERMEQACRRTGQPWAHHASIAGALRGVYMELAAPEVVVDKAEPIVPPAPLQSQSAEGHVFREFTLSDSNTGDRP